jgi:hypothetical protein
MTRSIPSLALLLLCAAGCASAAEPATAPPRSALETLRAGGRFAFSLDESDPAAGFRADCAAQHPGDAAGATTCYEAVRAVGEKEGFRFSLDPAGRLVWTSYGVEDGQPATYIEAHLDAALETEGVVAAKLAEPAHGRQVEATPLPPSKVFRFQLLDPNTLVVVDGRKGKLVYHRRVDGDR